jgi:hypothetical protein
MTLFGEVRLVGIGFARGNALRCSRLETGGNSHV